VDETLPQRISGPFVEWVHVCERCGATMEERKCKIVCTNCGMFRDCSDP
jgi:hypothetical protein